MLPAWLAPHAEKAYALLRMVAGGMLAMHGAQKILGILDGKTPPAFSQVWFGGWIELLGGTAIALGLFTSWAAFLCSGTMAVAYVQFHWKLRLGADFFPIVNKGEPALLYAFLFLFIACKGGGIWSLDRRRSGRSG